MQQITCAETSTSRWWFHSSTCITPTQYCKTLIHFAVLKFCTYASKFTFTLLGKLLRVDLLKLVSVSARPYGVRPQKSCSDLNEIWCVGRGRLVLHNRMPYDPIWGQGQGQGHGGPEVAKMVDFKVYLLYQHAFNQKITVNPPKQYLNFVSTFFIFILVRRHVTFKVSALGGVLYGVYLLFSRFQTSQNSTVIWTKSQQ